MAANVTIQGNTPKIIFSGNAIYLYSWGQVNATETEIRFITADNVVQKFAPSDFGGSNGIIIADDWANNNLLTPPVADTEGGGGGGDASAAHQLTQIGLETDIKNLITALNGLVSTSANQTTANTTLSNLLTELQQKADLTETQPVSVLGVSTEVKQDNIITIISNLDQCPESNAIPDTKIIRVEDFQTGDGGINEDPYPLIAIRKRIGVSNVSQIGLISAFAENNDDYAVRIYEMPRGDAATRTGVSITYDNLDSNLEAYAFSRTAEDQVTFNASDIPVKSYEYRDTQNMSQKVSFKMQDNRDYLIVLQAYSDGLDFYLSVNPLSFNY